MQRERICLHEGDVLWYNYTRLADNPGKGMVVQFMRIERKLSDYPTA